MCTLTFVLMSPYLQEITHLRREVGRLSLDGSKTDEKVQDESRRRLDVESRNKVLEEEMTKVQDQESFINSFCTPLISQTVICNN